jgi:hypothetical protein
MYDVYQDTWNTLTGPDAPFEVVEIEVRNSPMRVFKKAQPSLREVWLSSLAYAERDYLVYGNTSTTGIKMASHHGNETWIGFTPSMARGVPKDHVLAHLGKVPKFRKK